MLERLRALLSREFIGVRRNLLFLLIILMLPIAFGIMFASFKQIIPKSTPALVIPEDSNVTQDDLRFAAGLVSYFSSPRIETDRQKAFDQLTREEAYFVVSAPHGIKSGSGEVVVYVDNSMSPISEISSYVIEAIQFELSQFGYQTAIRVSKVGSPITPLEFFMPGVILLLLSMTGFLVIPFSAIRDSEVIQRLSPQLPLTTLIASKLAFGVFLGFIQIVLLFLTQEYLEVPLMDLSLPTVAVIFLTAVSLMSIGLAVAFLFKFSDASKYINSLLFALTIIFSGAFYPVGFLPSYLQAIAKSFPTYYTVVLIRSFGMKGAAIGLFPDYILIVAGFFILSVALLLYSAARFKDGR